MKKEIKLITPEEALEKFFKWFDANKRLAFLVALIFGLITHITMITETIMSQDGLWNSMDYHRAGDWETTLGRWGIEILGRATQFIAIPSINTVFCIVIMAITAVFIVDILDLKSKVSIIFTSLAIVLTPTLVATLLYIYTAFAYCANFLISTLVIWFLYKFKHKKLGIIISVLCFMFSLSVYQSYIGISIGLCIMISILELFKNKEIKEVFINIGKAVLVVLIGAILYYITTQIILKVSGMTLSDYNNAKSISVFGMIVGLKDTLIQTYKDFFEFFFGNDIVYNTNFRRELVYGLFFIMTFIATIAALGNLKEENKKQKITRIALIVLFILVLPIGLNIIDLIVVGNVMYSLTSVQMILMIPFAFAIFELLDKYNIIKWGAILSLVVVMWSYYIADNTSYAALKLTYNQAYSSTMRVLDRIETTPGYKKDMPILFGGIIGNNNYPRTSSLYGFTIGSMVNNTAFHGPYGGAMGTWVKFMKVFYGLDIKLCTAEEYQTIVTSPEYKENMECFPEESSIKIMHGIVVVKLDEEPYLPY